MYAAARSGGPPLRGARLGGHHGRRAWRDGGGEPRRQGGRRALGRLQHRNCRTSRRRTRTSTSRTRSSHFYARKVMLREAGGGVRHLPRRLRHARRAVRGADADPDRQGLRTSLSCCIDSDYWGELLGWIEGELLADGMISPDDLDLLFVTDDLDEAVERDPRLLRAAARRRRRPRSRPTRSEAARPAIGGRAARGEATTRSPSRRRATVARARARGHTSGARSGRPRGAAAGRARAARSRGCGASLNATGVVVHTNLGRAPLAEAALDRVREVGARLLEPRVRPGRRRRAARGRITSRASCAG